MQIWRIGLLIPAGMAIATLPAAPQKPGPRITIDGKFADWAGVPAHADPANNEHDTDHKGRHDKPKHVDHPDVDILEYKLTHDVDNLYAYFKARGVIGRT